MPKTVERRQRSRNHAPPAKTRMTSEVTLGTNGRIVIPSEVREALGLGEGDKLTLTATPGGITLTTPAMAIRRMQQELARLVPRGRSLADELIAERRREVARGTKRK
jgi:AbrB family looped-hinge helix DNA binding protein